MACCTGDFFDFGDAAHADLLRVGEWGVGFGGPGIIFFRREGGVWRKTGGGQSFLKPQLQGEKVRGGCEGGRLRTTAIISYNIFEETY